MTKPYTDIYYESEDGLRLFARDYGHPKGESLGTLFCMHGLTRNSSDFEELAQIYAPHYRVVTMDQRGRGRSEYDSNPAHYRPDIYCGDMFRLLTHLQLEDIIAVGTSMGGLMAMVMSALQPNVFKAVVLNDIGPVVDQQGLKRIRSYVGVPSVFADWDAAIAEIKASNNALFPKLSHAGWTRFAKQVCEQSPNGSIRFAYDAAIGEGVKSTDNAVPPDLWSLFDGLNSVPLLVIRGATSDLLSRATVDAMQTRHPDMQQVEVPHVGHAPMLNEAVPLQAIAQFLERVALGRVLF